MRLSLIAGMVGFAILGASLGPSVIGQASVGVACLFGLGALVHWLVELKSRRQDPYSLALLRQIQEQGHLEPDEDDLNSYDPSGSAICTFCGEEYNPALHRCPRCQRSLY